MILIGIDVAKDKHDCHIMTTDGEILCDNFTFQNSRSGFEEFLALSRGLAEKSGEKVKVGLEATGHYSTNLLSFLAHELFEVVVLNPLSVNRQRTADTLRRTKTDKNDARYIAKMLMTSGNKPYQAPLYHIEQLKSITRARYRLIKEIQPLKNRYRRLIQILFPEIQGFFCKLDIAAVLALFTALPSAHDISTCNITKLTNILSDSSHGRFKREKAVELKSLAASSIATFNNGDAFELKLTVKRIAFLESQKDEIEAEIRAVMSAINSPITSITGIGTVLGATIIGEIGNIQAFSNPAKLLAFAGCEPSTYQSGKYTATATPMVKHGSKYLRNALYLATSAAYVNCAVFRTYIDRKRAQGKHFYVAMSHGMKKMIRIIFAVLTKNTPFVEVI